MLPPVGNPNSGAGERLAAYLADVSKALTVATPEERNRIARTLFASVIVDNKQAVACVPRPELEPFFRTLAVKPNPDSCNGGSDGHCSHNSGIITAVIVVSLPPARVYQRALTGDQAAYVAAHPERSLRDLAEVVGASHETIRKARR